MKIFGQLIVILGFTVGVFANGKKGDSMIQHIRHRAQVNPDSVLCQLQQVDVDFHQEQPHVDSLSNDKRQNPDSLSLVCVAENEHGADQTYGIDDPETVIGHINSMVEISGAQFDGTRASLRVGDRGKVKPTPHPHKRRLLTSTSGIHRLLVLRVTYKNQEPSLSAETLAGRVFGIGAEALVPNLASQYQDCSSGKLQIVPASGTNIQNGVAEVSISDNVTGDFSVRLLENLVLQNATVIYGKLYELVEHVVMVMPNVGLLYDGRDYLAYGFLGGYLTVFNDDWAGRLSALVHEVGHNFMLYHSGEDNEVYGDLTGYMGYGSWDIGGPKSCFNADKHWSLGWFADRSLSLESADLPWVGYLAFFGEYNVTTKEQSVLINVGLSNPRLFLQYNVAKGINDGTREFANQVVIVSDSGNLGDPFGIQSWLQGAASLGQDFIYTAYTNGTDLVVRVCEQIYGPPDNFRLSIYLDDGNQTDPCGWQLGSKFCDDNLDAMFFVNDIHGYQSCGWLMRRTDIVKSRICVPGHEAYDLCEETCGKCTENCWDNQTAQFFVNNHQGYRDCEWLASRSVWQDKLCYEGHDAYLLCRKACDVCEY